jgi:hypothetical protein
LRGKDDKEIREKEICVEISETKKLEIKRGFLTLNVKTVTNGVHRIQVRNGLEKQCPETLYRSSKKRNA